jgi:AcrR family transcriptional regulator
MPRKNNPKETVERVLTAAMQLFNEKGYDKTSMQDIMDLSDMSKGAIFYHFKSKEEIFEAAMERQYEFVGRRLTEWLETLEGLNAREKIIELIKMNITDKEIVASNANWIKIHVYSPHVILAHMKRNTILGAPILTNLIEEGIKDGSIQTDYPVQAAELFLHLANYWCDPILFPCDITTVRKRLECLQFLLKSLGVDVITDEIIDITMDVTNFMYDDILVD